MTCLTLKDRLGLIRPALDAHTLGLYSSAQLLADCGYTTVIADPEACEACSRPESALHAARLRDWIMRHHLTAIGFSYRLDPRDGADLFDRFCRQLVKLRLLGRGGPIKAVYFAGLPEACARVMRRRPTPAGVFNGDETPMETLQKFGIDPGLAGQSMAAGIRYDEDRLAFGRELIRKEQYLSVKPSARYDYAEYGTARDTLVRRLQFSLKHGLPPLMRAHVGPYLPNRQEAIRLFHDWARQLAQSGLLDVLSIGTSQLTQSHFGQKWGRLPNGGGVPLNSPEEFSAVWRAAHPMLVRSYAGTQNIPAMAEMFENTLHMAWHALSFWWFCRIDGRGPYSVRQNLEEHGATLRIIAASGKPFEPNVPHHFAFRGADDVTYIVSALIAAKTAKQAGIRHLVLQTMLNTPKATWGIADLAKTRALLTLVRELESRYFRVILQPRGGLDYFSADLDRAKSQLAAVTALMDDIEPRNPASPPIIHVVSYSEATRLADPSIVAESIKITRHALDEYRRLRRKGHIDDMTAHPEVRSRTRQLMAEARCVIKTIEAAIPHPYTPEGLYRIFAAGFLPVPYLWEGREEFQRATVWPTRLLHGSMRVVDKSGMPLSAVRRMRTLLRDFPLRGNKG